MYLLKSSAIIIILAGGIGLSIWWMRNKKTKDNKHTNTDPMRRRNIILVKRL